MTFAVKDKKLFISTIILVVFHAVGIVGLQTIFRETFIQLSSLNLILSCVLLFINHTKLNKSFFLYFIFTYFSGFFIELVGIKTGAIFGSYSYGDSLGIKLFQNDKEENEFNQFIKQRNIIVHNRGIISKEFSKEFSTEEVKYIEGQKLNFNYEQLSMINGAIMNFISELDLMICKKFKLETIKVL